MVSEARLIEEEIIRQSSAGAQRLPMMDVFLARLPAALAGALRSRQGLQTDVLHHSARYDTFAALAAGMQDHTLVVEAEALPWQGKAYILLEPALLYAALEMQMGGQADAIFLPARAASMIERRLAKGICEIALSVTAETIARVTPVQLKSLGVETLEQVQGGLPGHTPCVAGLMELRIGATTGQMAVVFPMSTLEPAQAALSTMFFGEKTGDLTWRDQIRENISETHVDLLAVMHVFDCAMTDVLGWQVGDVVPLDLLEVPEIRMICSGSEILYGDGGQCGDRHYAVSLTREATPGAEGFRPAPVFRSGLGSAP